MLTKPPPKKKNYGQLEITPLAMEKSSWQCQQLLPEALPPTHGFYASHWFLIHKPSFHITAALVLIQAPVVEQHFLIETQAPLLRTIGIQQ